MWVKATASRTGGPCGGVSIDLRHQAFPQNFITTPAFATVSAWAPERLRWHIQSGNIVIPGSKNPAHIRDNFALFDFSLDEGEMAKINAMDRKKRYYTSTPELLNRYVEMVPPVDEQK